MAKAMSEPTPGPFVTGDKMSEERQGLAQTTLELHARFEAFVADERDDWTQHVAVAGFETHEDAAEWVRRVNAHDDLLVACEAVDPLLRAIISDRTDKELIRGAATVTLSRVEDAIAKARDTEGSP